MKEGWPENSGISPSESLVMNCTIEGTPDPPARSPREMLMQIILNKDGLLLRVVLNSNADT
jgi:hypothetical protein